jgi:hypothetical protein
VTYRAKPTRITANTTYWKCLSAQLKLREEPHTEYLVKNKSVKHYPKRQIFKALNFFTFDYATSACVLQAFEIKEIVLLRNAS